MEPSAIGPYRILAPLGSGGMGVVYRARHTSSERAVALKTVRVPAQRWLESIRREIHALTRIRHPGIVRIVDHGVDQGRPWYAMDLLEGETLGHFAERIWSPFRRMPHPPVLPTATVGGPADFAVPPSRTPGAPTRAEAPVDLRLQADGPSQAAAGELRTVLRIMRRVCASLAFLHGEGFVNCDLKPKNIVLLEGQPVIIDFGLASQYPAASGREALEAQRGASGTVPYMSPEQIRGEFVDARSDLYALGCMLYELVVGSPPFEGPPASIRSGHLSQTPVPPSELVTDVPPELERVMLKLLDKDLAARFGYADEVAALLADLSDDVHRLPDFPPPRSYLYRPRLVGRKALIAELNTLRERAAEGSGTLVLLAGESGVGKTRVAMEVTRLMSGSWMQTVTSESSLLPSDGGGGASPLQAVRPLLQAIADHCQEAGAETTERLLGDRRSVLAQYEPLLAQVPAAPGSMAPPMPLAVDASRRRLFKYLSETLAAFAQEQPVLWVIDDLGWADDLSLAFLQSLTREYLEATRVLILCTYRSEEATDAVTAIASLPHVTHITVPRLGRDAVSTMVGDMLAMPEKRDDFVEFVSHQAEGNPFFVTEYLRAAVTERVLYRDGQHSWQMPGHGRDGVQQLESLPLPGSLREVIEQRLRRLSPAGQQAGLAAAVLGREADVDVVREVASLSDEAAVGAVDELLRRQVLQQTEEGRVRFVHDKLREVAYAHAPAERVVALHARAASALESRWKDRPEANQHWATLGHHFAAAKRAKPAATYLKLAADHARATYANGDAIRLYREAIKQVNETLLSLSTESARPRELLIELNEALGDVLALTGKGDDARAAYEMALGLTAEDAAVGRARLYRKVGKTCETQHKHAEALAQYTLARRFVSTNPIEASAEERDEWFQVRVDELWVYYWLDKADTMAPIVTDLSSFVDNFATSLQRMKFFRAYFLLNLRKDRFVITPETLRLTHAAFTACNGSVADAERAFAQFHHGFALLFSNAIEEAIAQLQSANDIAVRLGDISLQARCFAYLALANRMGGHPTNTLEFTESCERIVHSSGMLEYVGTSHAHRAWLCMRKGDLIAGRREAEEALLVWRNRIFPFHWLALLPLLAASLSTDNVSEAVRFAEALLDPTQQRLPGQSPLLLQRAIETWASNDGAAARSLLQTALKGLDDAGYR